MNTNEQAPFDPIYDEDNPYRTEVPERFVYDAELDEHGLAEMPGPERDVFLDELKADIDWFYGEMFEPSPYDGTYSEI
jgi:hypothetical protein